MKPRINFSPRSLLAGIAASLAVFNPLATPAADAAGVALPLPIIERFENFGLEDGIPAPKVHSVLRTRDGRLWIGTWDGLCVREDRGKFWKTWVQDKTPLPSNFTQFACPKTSVLLQRPFAKPASRPSSSDSIA